VITTNGKNIVAKYLLNQAPEFASHIAIGVGGQSYPTSSSATFSEDAESLEFEVARVPILSKGLLKELDPITNEPVEKIVFKAELPIEQRYQITELGIYPAATNAVAGNFDSRIISTFSNSEPWAYSNNQDDSGNVEYIGPLRIDDVVPGDVETYLEISPENVYTLENFVFINSNSPIFEYSDRVNRGEPPRYLDKSLLVSGSTSVVNTLMPASSASINVSSASSYYIENNTISLNLGNNLPTDQIKLAFSVVSLEREGVAPDNVKIRLEFLNNAGGSTSKAFVNIALQQSDLDPPDEREMRYQVITNQLSDFTTTENFSWSLVNAVRIYTSIHNNSHDPTGQHFVFYDGLRFENVSSYNPLYSLVAAEYVKTLDENPILKRENSTSYVEYRFGIGVI
jgi:hypothetical protein